MAGIRVEVRPHAVSEIDRLTYIDDGPVLIAVQVTTWFCGEGSKSPLDLF